MSLLDIADKYEKMLKDPNKRKTSTGQMKQPTPYDEIGIPDPDTQIEEGVSAEEKAYLAEIDRRVSQRQQGTGTVNENDRLVKMEKSLNDIKDLLVEMMKAQMQILESKKE
jgi:hypothetical protein